MRDERALGDFLRIFLGVAKLRRAHLDRDRSVVSGTAKTVYRRDSEDDEGSFDGSEHTIRATPIQGNTAALQQRISHERSPAAASKSRLLTPEKRKRNISANSTPSSNSKHSVVTQKPQGGADRHHIRITEREISTRDAPQELQQLPVEEARNHYSANVPPPASDTSSVPSDFIHNVNERVSNIWSKLNSRASRPISDRLSDNPSSHSPRRPLSYVSTDANQLPTVPEVRPEASAPRSADPQTSYQEPTPQLRAWLDAAGNSARSTPRKRSGLQSSHSPESRVGQQQVEQHDEDHTGDLSSSFVENPFYDPHQSSPRQNGTIRSRSSLKNHTMPPPKFSLRRTISEPHLTLDVSKASFAGEPIRLPRQLKTIAPADHASSSGDEDDEDDGDLVSESSSSDSSIATSALSASSVEWSDSDSIAELRKKRLDALDHVRRAQEQAAESSAGPATRSGKRQSPVPTSPVTSRTPLKGKENKPLAAREPSVNATPERYHPQAGYSHHRRRSSIPSTFIHNRDTPNSTVSYETISPNSSASVAAERWKSRVRVELDMEDASPLRRHNPIYDRRGGNVVFDEEDEDSANRKHKAAEVPRSKHSRDDETEELEKELKGLDEVGLSESRRQIMLFEKLIKKAAERR